MHGRICAGGLDVARSNNGSPLRRKIQRLGASSLIVTLPKDWARRHNVKVGDAVSIYDEGDKLVIVPEGGGLEINLAFSLNHVGVERHVGRILLCAYTFGFDKVLFYSSKPIKPDFDARLRRVLDKLPESRSARPSDRIVEVDLGGKDGRLEDILVTYGRSIARMLSRLSGLLMGKIELTREDFAREYSGLERLNYKLLRIANSTRAIDNLEEKQCRYLVSASNLIGLVADAVYKLGIDLLGMIDSMTSEEKERLAFLLQVLEVAVSTVVLSLNPPSVKKAEESYEKVREILGLEGQIADIVQGASPAFAYLLARIIDVARIIEISEYIMLCHAVITKYGESPDKLAPGI